MKSNMSECTKVELLSNACSMLDYVKKVVQTNGEEEVFYVCDIGDIVRKYKNWNTLMPRVHPYYAVKCNDSSEVLKTLAALGAGFDCATRGEIRKLLELGVAPQRIIYAHPAKQATHLKFAASNNLRTMTFDSEHELFKIKQLQPEARLVLRIRSDATKARYNLGVKFGCDPGKDAPRLLRLAKQLNQEVVGVSFHVGSSCFQPDAYSTAIRRARDVFDIAERDFGFHMSLLDIGGGFPGEKNTTIEDFAVEINTALQDYFPENRFEDVKIISEPGKYFVASAYTLASNIHSIKDIRGDDGRVNHRMYYLDDGVYGSFHVLNNEEFKDLNPIPIKVEDSNSCWNRKNGALGDKMSSSFWGPTCDGLDVIFKEIKYPIMEIGDWVMFEDMGAYILNLRSNFNGFSTPTVRVVADPTICSFLQHQDTENYFEVEEREIITRV